MKVYIATNFYAPARFRRIRRMLAAREHEVVHDWTGEDPDGDLAGYAEAAIRGLESSDVLVCAPLEEARGTWVEFGIMVARCRPIVLIGRGPVFAALPTVFQVETIPEAIEKVVEIDAARRGLT